VVDVRRSVPDEKEAEERLVAAPPLIEILEQEEERQGEKAAPLELNMRDLRQTPGNEGVDEPGEQGRGGIAGHVPREGPGGDGGQEGAEQEHHVVDGECRGARRVEGKSEDRGAQEV